MFIKQVKISGFKSFGETTVFGDFSPKKNCIYGLNGTGKSSFFSAIEFVFLDEFSHLRPADRQSLLYSGDQMLSMPAAYVEITFDNTAQRLPIKDNEVTIRRSIGINKDEYFIQRKHSTRQDLINLFDAANYSMNSGLFSVRQGRVKTVAEMSDADRLELIFEISGMRTYDEQRRESVMMLAQAEKRREKIDQAIIEIDKKLEQIHKEKIELEEYEKISRIKRAIEYIICEDEREEVDEKLGEDETNIANESSVVDSLQIEKDRFEATRTSLEDQLKILNNQIEQNEHDYKIMEEKRQELIKKKARSDCVLEVLQKKTDNAESNLNQLQAKKEQLIEKFQNLSERIQDCKQECDDLNNQKIHLESILNYSQSLKKTNDDIDQVNQQIEKISAKIEDFQDKNQNELETLKSKVSKAEDKIVQKKEEKKNAIEEDSQNQSEKIKCFNEKKLLFKKQYEYQKYIQNQEIAYQKAVSDYEHMMGETSEAIHYIKNNYTENDGYYGQLIDLIDFDESLNAAVDSSAGKRLFYVVVESEDLAIHILDSLKSNNVFGQVNFFLLNRIKGTRKNIEKTQNSEPLIDLIQFDQKVKSVVEFVFGSIALCSTINIATEIAETKNVTCVTLSGDTVHYSGVITGGYISSKRSIARAKKSIESMKAPLEKSKETLEEIDQKIVQIDIRINEIDKQISASKDKIPSISEKIIKTQSKLDKRKKEIKRIEDEFQSMQNSLEDLQAQKQNLEEKANLHEQKSSISSSNREDDKEKLVKISSELARKKLEYQKINIDINEFQKQIDSTNKEIDDLQQDKINELKNKAEKERKEIQEAIESFENENTEIESTKNSLQAQLDDLTKNLKKAKENEKECNMKLSYEANRLEELNRSKTNLISRKDEIIKNIANIGTLPMTEIEEYKEEFRNKRMSKYNELKKINSQLQSFRFVNKKAIEQFKQFEKQGIDLKERQEDITKSIEPIKKLISQLDKNKEKAVTRTFSLVYDNFSKIYQKLDPNRTASLILTTQDDANNELIGLEIAENDDSDQKTENEDSSTETDTDHENDNDTSDFDRVKKSRTKKSNVLNLTGMSISVNGEKIEALSGGEKTLVAIALLFALQQTETNPFYLFDEIDSDLDINAREALAKMIDDMTDDVDMTKNVQFIYTTHRSELIEHADKFFAMKHTNGSSVVRETSYEDAMAFISDIHDD